MAVSESFRPRGAICRGGSRRRRRWGCSGRRRRGGCSRSAWSGCGRGVRRGAQPPVQTEVVVSGQLALAVSEERLVAAAVWETLPPEVQREGTVRLARLLGRVGGGGRGEGA